MAFAYLIKTFSSKDLGKVLLDVDHRSDDSVELCGVLERQIDHVERRDLADLLASLHEVEAVTSDLPSDLLPIAARRRLLLRCGRLLLVLRNKGH